MVGYGLSEEFKVNIGLRQGNDPLLFIMVVEVQQVGCSQEGDVCKRSGHDSRQKTRTTGSVGGMEGGVQEGRTDNEPGEDRRDVGLTSERGLEH